MAVLERLTNQEVLELLQGMDRGYLPSMSYNQLTRLPEWLGGFQNLRRLEIGAI